VKTARFIRRLAHWKSDARVYELSEPFNGFELVIVSAVDALFSGPETYIFGATVESLEENRAADYLELDGSFRGALDHERALRNAGYSPAVEGVPS
jgi:hypothetical protein